MIVGRNRTRICQRCSLHRRQYWCVLIRPRGTWLPSTLHKDTKTKCLQDKKWRIQVSKVLTQAMGSFTAAQTTSNTGFHLHNVKTFICQKDALIIMKQTRTWTQSRRCVEWNTLIHIYVCVWERELKYLFSTYTCQVSSWCYQRMHWLDEHIPINTSHASEYTYKR